MEWNNEFSIKKNIRVEGTFNGRDMEGDDGSFYPVPGNYASKSLLVEGDRLAMEYDEQSLRFIFKQIGPVDRVQGICRFVEGKEGEDKVMLCAPDGSRFRIHPNSLTFHKLRIGDEAFCLFPADNENPKYGVIQGVIRK